MKGIPFHMEGNERVIFPVKKLMVYERDLRVEPPSANKTFLSAPSLPSQGQDDGGRWADSVVGDDDDDDDDDNDDNGDNYPK